MPYLYDEDEDRIINQDPKAYLFAISQTTDDEDSPHGFSVVVFESFIWDEERRWDDFGGVPDFLADNEFYEICESQYETYKTPDEAREFLLSLGCVERSEVLV